MDKPRPGHLRRKRIKRAVLAIVGLAAVAVITIGVSRLEPAAPSVDANTVYQGVVERGEMLRQVRAVGRLVPEEVRWIPATTSGLVERIFVLPGEEVQPDTILAELSNPELEQQTLDAELAVRAAEADMANQRIQIRNNELADMVSAAQVEANFEQNRLQYEADVQLNEEGLMPSLDLNMSRLRTQQSERQWELEQMRLESASEANEATLDAAEARLEQIRGTYLLRRDQLQRLQVRAGTSGILEQVPIEVGQQIASGTNVARVSRPEELMAELNVPETQARDIQLGQAVAVDTRNGIIPGRVARVDPTVINGTVTVDVRLEGELPRGARPDLTVDGVIEIERLDDVLYLDRPTYAQANSTISLFKVLPDGQAVRTPVRLGIISVSEVEVLEGLQIGDEVILSDMSAWDEYDRIQLN